MTNEGEVYALVVQLGAHKHPNMTSGLVNFKNNKHPLVHLVISNALIPLPMVIYTQSYLHNHPVFQVYFSLSTHPSNTLHQYVTYPTIATNILHFNIFSCPCPLKLRH